jgi:hypothetical protein
MEARVSARALRGSLFEILRNRASQITPNSAAHR